MNTEDKTPRTSVCITSSFGGLAAQGINASYRQSQNGINITRSSRELVIAAVGLFGLASGPLFFLGADQIRLALGGDFGGDRLFLLIFEIFVVAVIGMFIKGNILRRPVATVSKLDRSIRYTHPGYDQIRIAAGDIAFVSVTECAGISTSPHDGRRIHYAATVHGKDGNAINIATHVNDLKMTELANQVAAVLAVNFKGLSKDQSIESSDIL